MFVDEPHQFQILGLDGFGPIVERGSVDSQQPALIGNAQLRLIRIDHLLSLLAA